MKVYVYHFVVFLFKKYFSLNIKTLMQKQGFCVQVTAQKIWNEGVEEQNLQKDTRTIF